MQQIINFIIRNKVFLLFLLLFSLSLFFTIQTHSFHKSKFVNSANFLTGGIYNSINNINSYFSLKKQNTILSEENNRLKAIVSNIEIKTDSTFKDGFVIDSTYQFTAANVLKNSYSLSNNVLLLDKGKKDSINEDFGVVSSKGIIGIVDNTSNRFSTVISILNTTSKISAQLKKTNHYGSLVWNSKSPEFVQLIDVAKIAPVKVGDTIVTSGRSSIFPKGILIGTVHDFHLDIAENFYEINIKLFNDMTSLEHVYIIENKDISEITNLLNAANE
ncbi:rod shape-determining protein MreC [Pseudalgibacter alginicilyticus]|uniref:Cell shape-determining protein MreC n=1 Tax=Pseudalgibacter alginicilyticus TaxID=1736674 RepID=A0A0P0CL22_9FLAO|nr:rod shape-determining protein MreC [Pseudalgibacter alginicilyticus]ALJ05108.1 rod shape-determining protein MreC [Pseudalgibacter alginicilyticus]